MSPQANLDSLAQRKGVLLASIRLRRLESSAQLGAVMEPVAWAESLYARWKAVSPLVKVAAMPVGALLKQKLFPQAGMLAGLMRWAPVALNLFRSRG